MNDIRLFQFSNYVRPALQVNKQKDWVLNGKKNEFYQYIIDRNNGSPTNASINKSYADLIYGRGLNAKNARINLQDWAKLKTILKPKDLRKIISDFQVFGGASFQVIKTKGNELSSITHIPKQLVVPSVENEDGEIEAYWFCRDWSNTFKNIPVAFDAYGNGTKDEIYVIKPYTVGGEYFEQPDYISGLMYAEMEEEIANLNISSIRQGLSGGYIVNIPDGKSLTAEEKDDFERKIKQKLTGSSNASNFVLSFNGRDVEVTIIPFPTNENIHKQWETLNETVSQKLLTAHRATSPSLVGIISSSGFSNTADEMDTAEGQLMKRVIQPKQQEILDALEEVLVDNSINLDLYFVPLTEVVETPMAMSSHTCLSDDGATEEMANTLIEFGEDLKENEWELLCGSEVEYETDDDIRGLIQFATSTGTARPLAKSEQDSKDIAIRYRYVGNPLPQRAFCQKMMLANKLYRKEDILQMEKSGINDGFGKGGSNSYSIWLWKGGGRLSANHPNGTCRHKWQREIYLRKGSGLDPRSPLAETISTSEARRRGYFVPPNNPNVGLTPNRNLL